MIHLYTEVENEHPKKLVSEPSNGEWLCKITLSLQMNLYFCIKNHEMSLKLTFRAGLFMKQRLNRELIYLYTKM